ncbi:MAG: thermonuclease family protein [Hyphomicrobiaceae bacterium]|nr:MAG: thermonuclease family protein [Hyphomicrobiaceae bacterium]
MGAITGIARVVDGDTITVGDTRVRLEGIDAPEAAQTCKRRWVGSWSCGSAATTELARLVDGKQVVCERQGLDKYGRTLGVCFADGQDINASMVRRGYAWAFTKYSARYVREEASARVEGLGIWQGEATPAWEFRQQRWSSVEHDAPGGCAIKGNITKNGKIYHMPWSPWYAQIKIEPEKGKRWFCTEAEAVAAGWRPVQAH